MATSEQIWLRVKKRIQSKLPAGEFRTWFSQTALEKLDGDSAVVSVPNRFYALWLMEKYLPAIEECLSKIVKGSPKVTFSYKQDSQDTGQDLSGIGSDLDPSMTFAEMQTGEWNRFAWSSALKITEEGSRAYNPLYIYSHPGLGRTHLLHAIGNRILAESPETPVIYTSAKLFASEFNRLFAKDQPQSFGDLNSAIGVLLFDDVHELKKQPLAQDVLTTIFDFLHPGGSTMVFTADRPPRELSGISEQLKSRLGWGVLAEIRTPDHNGMVEFIKRKEKEVGVHLPEDVVFFLSHASRDIKALTRNLMKLKTYSSLKGGQINVSMVVSLIKGTYPSRIGIEDIKSVTAGYFNIPIHELTSGNKKRAHSYPRQVAMYLARKYTDLSFKQIGSSFGHKDHSTVIHAIRRIEEKRDQGRSTKDDLTRIENLIS